MQTGSGSSAQPHVTTEAGAAWRSPTGGAVSQVPSWAFPGKAAGQRHRSNRRKWASQTHPAGPAGTVGCAAPTRGEGGFPLLWPAGPEAWRQVSSVGKGAGSMIWGPHAGGLPKPASCPGGAGRAQLPVLPPAPQEEPAGERQAAGEPPYRSPPGRKQGEADLPAGRGPPPGARMSPPAGGRPE